MKLILDSGDRFFLRLLVPGVVDLRPGGRLAAPRLWRLSFFPVWLSWAPASDKCGLLLVLPKSGLAFWYIYITFLCVCINSPVCVIMPLYEAKRAVIGTLPDLVLNPPPTLSALLDDFELQLGETVMKGMICNIMQYTSKSFLLHLASPEQVQELVANGLTFRSHPVHIEPCRSITNVTLERVPYGLPGSTVMSALRPYGNCKGARPVTHKGFGISKLIVEIEMTKDIPSRIYIQGNPINVFYRNQPRSCFVCSEKGHEAKSCPKKRAKKRPADASSTAATDPGDKRVCNTVLPTFANVVSGASPSVLPPVPSVTTAPLPSGPPVDAYRPSRQHLGRIPQGSRPSSPPPPPLSTGSSDNSPDLFSQSEPASAGGGLSARRSSRSKVVSSGRRKSLRSDSGFGKMKNPTSTVFLSRKQCSPSPLPTSRSRSQSLSSLNTNRFAPLSMDNDGDNID